MAETEAQQLEHLEGKIQEYRYLFEGVMLFLKEQGETKTSFVERITNNPRLWANRPRPKQGEETIVSNIPNDILSLLDS